MSELFIGGTWRDAGNGGRRNINPFDQSLITMVADGGPEDTEVAILASATQLATVERDGRLGVEQGARLLAGGRRPDKPELAQGFFYLPTVFAEITPVREETFGQIITAERFDTEAEAVALGNDTEYGLAGAVSTRDLARGERVARLLRHGTLWINDFGPYLPSAEWSGFKRSGTGRRTRPVGPAR
jgi:betaine-aldehyde dehydrogenase